MTTATTGKSKVALSDSGASLVQELSECRLLSEEHAQQATRFLEQSGGDAAALAEFLVGKGILTRMQAEHAAKGKARDLVYPHFTLTDVLGTGSLGAVYQARSTKDGALYAVKVVPRRNVVSLTGMVEKVKALKEIRHPRVSALVHIGALGERVYLAWPYLEGGEKLDAVVGRQGKLTPRQAVQIALQVASGLQAYHKLGLYHGLLKPSDILIGSDRRVRILDFGVGFLLACERGKSLLDTMTNTRALARGLDCTSPEAILNPLDRSPAGDQYSLGCILYFCLAGQFPFTDPQPVKKMMAHQFEEPQPIRELNGKVSPRLAALITRLMRKSPEERFASTDEAVLALQAMYAELAGHPTPKSVPVVHGKTGATTPAEEEAPTPVEEADAPAPQAGAGWMTKLLVAAGLGVGMLLGGGLAWFLSHHG
jgi:serine/threonine-protein kinase